MVKLRRSAIVAAALIALLSLTQAPTPAYAAEYQGCPDGWVCLYPQNAGWNGGHPSHKWFRYGSYDLSNQLGIHRFLNNQTGGAKAWTCRNYGGTNCPTYQPAGTWWDYDFTPINSVKLTP